MTSICKFPNCKRIAEKNGYCIGHRGFASFTPAKAPKKINRESEQRKKDNKEYKKIVIEKMLQSKNCEIKSPVCTKRAEGLHHMKKRGAELLNKKYLKRSCNPCNQYLEEHPNWGKEKGFIISKHQVETSN
jgi:hypothetical protein